MKRLLTAAQGEIAWPPPIWLMRQAGRYLPEYRALRAQVPDFVEFCLSPALASEATLQPIRRFGMDGAILFSDILILPWALGRGLAFSEGQGPRLPPITSVDEVRALDHLGFLAKTAPVLETIWKTRAALAEAHPETALIGFVGAPFTVACYMVEGGGSKEFAATRRMAAGMPETFSLLIDILTECSITYLSAQIEAGAEAVMLFDSWAGLLSPSAFARHVIAPTRRIAGALRERHPGVPIIGFPRLAGTMIGAYAAETGVHTIGMDTATDPAILRRMVGEDRGLQGNLDPFALVAGGDAMLREADAILSAMQNRPFIFNLGHGVLPQTPPEHVADLVQRVRKG